MVVLPKTKLTLFFSEAPSLVWAGIARRATVTLALSSALLALIYTRGKGSVAAAQPR